jgi:DNA invertase Pin-like site-specific DNA recombinase
MDERYPVSRLLLHVLGAAAEFKRSLILERSQAGQRRYREAFQRGEVGRTVHNRSGRDLPPHRPRRIFDREAVISLHHQGLSMRQIARQLDLGLGESIPNPEGAFQKYLRRKGRGFHGRAPTRL